MNEMMVTQIGNDWGYGGLVTLDLRDGGNTQKDITIYDWASIGIIE